MSETPENASEMNFPDNFTPKKNIICVVFLAGVGNGKVPAIQLVALS